MMNNAQKGDLLTAVRQMAEFYHQKLNPLIEGVYLNALGSYPHEQVMQAMTALMAKKDWMPKPCELVEQLNANTGNFPAACENFRRMIRGCTDSWSTWIADDPQFVNAIKKAFGSLRSLGASRKNEEELVAAFAYAYKKEPPLDDDANESHVLPGIDQSRYPAVQFVGDYKRCKAWLMRAFPGYNNAIPRDPGEPEPVAIEDKSKPAPEYVTKEEMERTMQQLFEKLRL